MQPLKKGSYTQRSVWQYRPLYRWWSRSKKSESAIFICPIDEEEKGELIVEDSEYEETLDFDMNHLGRKMLNTEGEPLNITDQVCKYYLESHFHIFMYKTNKGYFGPNFGNKRENQMMSKGSKNIRSFDNCGEDFERMRIYIGESVFNATALSVVVPFAEKLCLSF